MFLMIAHEYETKNSRSKSIKIFRPIVPYRGNIMSPFSGFIFNANLSKSSFEIVLAPEKSIVPSSFKLLDNPEHTHPLSGIKSRIQKESIFSLNPDLCQISTKRSNNM